MDFIERLVGLAPDGGNGLTELVLIAAAALGLALARRHGLAMKLAGRLRR